MPRKHLDVLQGARADQPAILELGHVLAAEPRTGSPGVFLRSGDQTVLNSASKGGGMRTARCSCGSVEIEAFGTPITSVVCYCDTCQKGSRQIEALTNAVPILGPDGGTAYILYRKDRIKYSKGAELLKGYKIEEKSTTSRVVATCCNSAMGSCPTEWCTSDPRRGLLLSP